MTPFLRGLLVASASCVVSGLSGSSASAGLVYYTNETTFDGEATGSLTNQNFSSANVGTSGEAVVAAPLNSTTNTSVFAAGSIVPGISFSTSTDRSGQEMVAIGSSAGLGNTNTLLANNFSGDSLNITFASPTSEVAVGLFNLAGAGGVLVTIKGTDGSVLGSITATGLPSSGAGKFFGVIDTDGAKIGEIDLLGTATNKNLKFAAIDRIEFGASPTAVPEPSTLALCAIGAALGLALHGRGRRATGRRKIEL